MQQGLKNGYTYFHGEIVKQNVESQQCVQGNTEGQGIFVKYVFHQTQTRSATSYAG